MARKITICIVILSAVILIKFDVVQEYQKYTNSKPTINVLFIGNSYTYYNDMPKMLENITLAHPSATHAIHAEKVTMGGADFKQHWQDKRAAAKIMDRAWDYVVLQDQSTTMLYKNAARESYFYAQQFNDLIKKSGAKTILYATWPRKPGHEIYKHFPKGYGYMKEIINSYYYTMAKNLGAGIVYTSDIWDAARQQHVTVYHSDGSHPSIYGSYFIALKFFHHFFPNAKIEAETIYLPQGVERQKLELVLSAMQQ